MNWLCFRRVNLVFVPVMASRLMLSLKKAAVEPAGQWSLQTMTDHGRRATMHAETVRFASRAFGVSQEISNGGDIELEPLPRSSRSHG